MNKKTLILILVAVAVLLTASCRRIDPIEQTSDLELVFSTEELGTKVTETINPTLQNGGKFSNLFVILVYVDNSGASPQKIIYWDQRTFSAETETGSVRFRNVKNNVDYQVYAFANLKMEGDYWTGKTEKEIAEILANDDNELSENASGKLVINGEEDAVVASGVESLLTSVESNKGAMLLTGRGTARVNGSTVTVNGASSGKITLQRPFVRLTVTIQNPTGRPILFDRMSFSAFKAKKTYLFGRQEDKIPVIPDEPGYEAFPVSSLPTVAWTTESKHVFSTYLFESVATEEYKMYGHVIMYTPNTNPLVAEKDLYIGTGELPDGENPSTFTGAGAILNKLAHGTNVPTPITYMTRNQAFDVILNIYYGSSTGSFTIEVDNSTWTTDKGGSHTFE